MSETGDRNRQEPAPKATNASQGPGPGQADNPSRPEPPPHTTADQPTVSSAVDDVFDDIFVEPDDIDVEPFESSAGPEPEVILEPEVSESPVAEVAPDVEEMSLPEVEPIVSDPGPQPPEVSTDAQAVTVDLEAFLEEVEPMPAEPEPVEPDPLAILELQLQEAQAAAQEFRDQLYRKAAELENTRRRLTRQVQDAKKYGGENVVKEFLPVVDDLERAISHARTANKSEADGAETSQVASFIDGMGLVQKKFENALQRFGVKGFESVGTPFNPQLHEAIQALKTDEFPNGYVAAEFMRGYMMHDRLVRPALVAVADNPEPVDDEPTEPVDEAAIEAAQQPADDGPVGDEAVGDEAVEEPAFDDLRTDTVVDEEIAAETGGNGEADGAPDAPEASDSPDPDEKEQV